MDIIQRIKHMFKEKFTFVVIPHNGKSTKQFKLHKPIIYSILTLFTLTLIFFITSTIFLFHKNTSLSNNLSIKDDNINRLNDIVEQQNTEIEDLKNTSKFVMDKLSQLYELEDKVRNMVGLSSNESNTSATTSRSLSIFSDTFNSLEYDTLNDLTNTDSMDAITSLINSEMENYDTLVGDVEKQLKYLDCKPDMRPVNGQITSPFGYRKHPLTKRIQFHKGIDIANKLGTKILAAGSGIVTYSGWNGGYGNVIIISHGYGYKSVYAHNDKNLVEVGDKIKKGQVIANLGNTGNSTGPHLHFEIRYNGENINPLKVLKDN